MGRDADGDLDGVAERIRLRIMRMQRAAEVVTKALGLPPDAESDILQVMFRMPEEAALDVQNQAIVERVYQRVQGFLRSRRDSRGLALLQAIWGEITNLSSNTIIRNIKSSSLGLPIDDADASSELLAIVAVTMWALQRADASEDELRCFATSRGCSDELAHALASYLYLS